MHGPKNTLADNNPSKTTLGIIRRSPTDKTLTAQINRSQK